MFLHWPRSGSDSNWRTLINYYHHQASGRTILCRLLLPLHLLAIFIIPGVMAMGLLGVFFAGKKSEEACMTVEANTETIRDVFVRAAKVYVFVMALLLLGAGMRS